MKNPILSSRKTTLIYFVIWIFFGLLFYLIFSKLGKANNSLLAADIFFQNLLFSLMLIGFWYPIHFMNIETMKLPTLVLNHILTFLVFLSIWIFGVKIILTLIFRNDLELSAALPNHLSSSMPVKILFCFYGYCIFMLAIYFIKYYNSYIDKREVESQLQASVKEAELTLLRNQMNPHFIFNSLNSISSLTIIDSEKAHEMVIKLSDFLRYTVSYGKMRKVSLEKELEMCRAYLDIEKIRFGDKIKVDFDVQEEGLGVEIPSMLLQTLFENAIKHGIYNSLNPEQIFFKARLVEDRLEIIIENTFDGSDLPKIGTKTGLKNIKERLKLMYQNLAIFETKTEDNKFIVWLNLPTES